jgi:hypothetical protein
VSVRGGPLVHGVHSGLTAGVRGVSMLGWQN